MGDIVRRGTAWYVRYKDVDGKRRMRASHQPTKELARRLLVEIEARVARGQAGIIEPASASEALTVAAVVDRFLTDYSRPKIKDIARYRSCASTALARLLPMLGAKIADKLTSHEVAKARDSLGRSHAPASVRVSLAFLGTVFSWAIRQGLVDKNPVRGVEQPQPEASVDFFSRAEIEQRFLAAAARFSASKRRADRMLACCALLALHTGLRKGELLGLRWRDLDLDTRRLTVAKSYRGTPKGGKARHLTIPAACLPGLQAWQPECPTTPEGLVFPVPQGGEWSHKAMLGLPKLLAEAGMRVPAHPWHAMRHTFASHYVMQGGNILVLQKILGHTDVKITAIYAHLAPEFLGAEMNRIQFKPQDKPQDKPPET